jgi:hypothetical protein
VVFGRGTEQGQMANGPHAPPLIKEVSFFVPEAPLRNPGATTGLIYGDDQITGAFISSSIIARIWGGKRGWFTSRRRNGRSGKSGPGTSRPGAGSRGSPATREGGPRALGTSGREAGDAGRSEIALPGNARRELHLPKNPP